MDELEARREALQSSILQAEITHPLYSEEDIVRWLTEFKGGDTTDFSYRRGLVDTFIQSVYSYEGYIVIFYNFHDGSRMVSNEEIQQAIRSDFKTDTPPKKDADSFELASFFAYLTALFALTGRNQH